MAWQCSMCKRTFGITDRPLIGYVYPQCRRGTGAEVRPYEISQALGAEALRSRSFMRSVPRLLIGTALVDCAVLGGGIASVFHSLLLCCGALAVVGKHLYGGTDVLERKRWSSFWRANVLVYWIVYLTASRCLPWTTVHETSIERRDLCLLGSLLACAVASVAGLCFAIWWDDANKRASLLELTEYQNRAPQTPEVEPDPVGNGVPVHGPALRVK